jgi:glycosyltransferase involved in cell wall biosynthesis
MNLQDSVSTNFEFLPDEEIVKLLAPCDLLAFPYGPSPEGASGAARMAIALDRPTLLSSSGVFRDLLPFSHLARRLDVETLAEALLGLAQDDAVRTLHDRARRRYAETHSWDVVSQRAANLMRIS